MRLLFLGDMVGKVGRMAVFDQLPDLINSMKTDFVIVNGENAANGFGVTQSILDATLAAGADVMTTWQSCVGSKRSTFICRSRRAVYRPANYPRERLPRRQYV